MHTELNSSLQQMFNLGVLYNKNALVLLNHFVLQLFLILKGNGDNHAFKKKRVHV